MIDVFQLLNGMVVVVAPNSTVPMVEVAIQYDYDPQTVADGVPHLVEHLLFESTENISNGDVDRWFRMAGGNSTATTSWNRIEIIDRISSSNLELLLFVEKERSLNLCPAVTPANLENQRQVIANEMFSEILRPLGGVADRLRMRTFADDPILSTEVMGTIYDLENATAEDVCDFQVRWLRPDNSLWLVSGDIDASELKDKLESTFSQIEGDVHLQQPASPSEEFSSTPKNAYRWHQVSEENRLTLIFPAAPLGTLDGDVQVAVMHTLLSSTSQKIPASLSTIDSVQGWIETQRTGGWMGISLQTSDPKMAIVQLETWFSQVEVDWALRAQKHAIWVEKSLLTNEGRLALIKGCVEALPIDSWENCFEWQASRFKDPVSPAVLQDALNGWDIQQASWLWMGQENWLQGTPW